MGQQRQPKIPLVIRLGFWGASFSIHQAQKPFQQDWTPNNSRHKGNNPLLEEQKGTVLLLLLPSHNSRLGCERRHKNAVCIKVKPPAGRWISLAGSRAAACQVGELRTPPLLLQGAWNRAPLKHHIREQVPKQGAQNPKPDKYQIKKNKNKNKQVNKTHEPRSRCLAPTRSPLQMRALVETMEQEGNQKSKPSRHRGQQLLPVAQLLICTASEGCRGLFVSNHPSASHGYLQKHRAAVITTIKTVFTNTTLIRAC